MIAIVKEPKKAPRVKVFHANLKTIQELVGGYIEIHELGYETGIKIVMDEEGLIKDREHNTGIGDYTDIRGTYFLCSEMGPELCSLNPEQIRTVMAYYNALEEADWR